MYNEDNCPNLKCRDCKYFSVRANAPTEVSQCKRIDNKTVMFYKPWFATYDCGASHIICSDFEPKNPHYADFKEWTSFSDVWPIYSSVWIPWYSHKKTTSFFLNGDFSVSYQVLLDDFVYGTMFCGNTLKAVSRQYYRRTNASPFGYRLITEEINRPANEEQYMIVKR